MARSEMAAFTRRAVGTSEMTLGANDLALADRQLAELTQRWKRPGHDVEP